MNISCTCVLKCSWQDVLLYYKQRGKSSIEEDGIDGELKGEIRLSNERWTWTGDREFVITQHRGRDHKGKGILSCVHPLRRRLRIGMRGTASAIQRQRRRPCFSIRFQRKTCKRRAAALRKPAQKRKRSAQMLFHIIMYRSLQSRSEIQTSIPCFQPCSP